MFYPCLPPSLVHLLLYDTFKCDDLEFSLSLQAKGQVSCVLTGSGFPAFSFRAHYVALYPVWAPVTVCIKSAGPERLLSFKPVLQSS